MAKNLKKTYLLEGVPLELGQELVNEMHINLNNIGLIFMNQKNDSYEIQAEIEETNQLAISMWITGWLSGYKNAVKKQLMS